MMQLQAKRFTSLRFYAICHTGLEAKQSLKTDQKTAADNGPVSVKVL